MTDPTPLRPSGPSPERDAEFAHLRRTWEQLGADDPLWAVLTDPARRRGGWDATEFLETGEVDVARYESLIRGHGGLDRPPRRVLDFGCGAGRLSLAWSRRAEHVTGVDISPGMIESARQLTASATNIEFVVNQRPDLRVLEDASFDLAFSHICLQHIPWSLAKTYVAEFARVITPDGLVVFQLPAHDPHGVPWRRRAVDALPAPIRTRYRTWRRGTPAVFDMHHTPRATVVEVAATTGLHPVHVEPDASAGPGIESYIYLFRPSQGPGRAELATD